ncbi:MAG: hypothetical protein JWP94_514 [Mucilaginibacter sp.]|nr:hypothetical protein [Mucilaginibacter sp.]
MSFAFSPSVNIIRDENVSLNYIPTVNAKKIVAQLQGNFEKGLRSFNLIGSYGTGKSAFLSALEQTLLHGGKHFDVPVLQSKQIRFFKIIGSYGSVIQAFADALDIHAEKNVVEHIFSELFNRYHQLGQEKPLLIVVIDELGKFLEYAAKHQPERELYFLQQLAEFANNARHRILCITTVHQGFDTYAYELNKGMRQEWTKVKGRFTELTFNEPVEQLLYLVSEHIPQRMDFTAPDRQVRAAQKLFDQSKAFKGTFAAEIAAKLYPMDLLAANLLALSLQSYGQNERSLFSFLESTDQTALIKFNITAQQPFYSIPQVFDYLNNNFYSYLHSKHNPDSGSWGAIRHAIEQVENGFDTDLNDYLKVIKAVGLLNIFSRAGAVLDERFLSKYAELCLGIPEADRIIAELLSKSVIRYRKHSKRYVLSEEAEIDIEQALQEVGDRVSEIADISSVLKKYFDFAPVLAKEYSYQSGTNRYFKFEIAEYPRVVKPVDENDGFIYLIFNEKIAEPMTLPEIADRTPSANVYVFYRNAKVIKELLFDLEKTKKVLQENQHDRVAKRELESIAAHQQGLLNHYILHNLYAGGEDTVWYWNGALEPVNSKKAFNQLLTRVCHTVYAAAPVFRNELVNKQRISNAIHSAKRNYFRRLVLNWNEPDLGIPGNLFPPEKMIYRSLLLDNGLSPLLENFHNVLQPGDNFFELMAASDRFLESTRQQARQLTAFAEVLSEAPFKLKQGFIDFWVPSYLFLKRNDFALYNDGAFIPTITDDTLELISKKPKDFQIKAFNVAGVRLDIFNSYRAILNQESKAEIDGETFIETIKPFLVFYRTLPEYAKLTNRLSKPALAIRKAISRSKDPEAIFFEAFPAALGFSIEQLSEEPELLVAYNETLQNTIREIRTCFDALVERFEAFIRHDVLFEEPQLDFEQYRAKLQMRLKPLKRHLLLAKQRTFVQRIDSLIDDNKAWLSSLCQALLGKPLEQINDEEEVKLYEHFKNTISELDSLTELSVIDIDEDLESVYNLQFVTFGSAAVKTTIRISKAQTPEIDERIELLNRQLTGDKEINKVILSRLLQKMLSND